MVASGTTTPTMRAGEVGSLVEEWLVVPSHCAARCRPWPGDQELWNPSLQPHTQSHWAALLPLFSLQGGIFFHLYFPSVSALTFVWIQCRSQVFPYNFLSHLSLQISVALMRYYEFVAAFPGKHTRSPVKGCAPAAYSSHSNKRASLNYYKHSLFVATIQRVANRFQPVCLNTGQPCDPCVFASHPGFHHF